MIGPARRLLSALLPADVRETVLDDLDAEYARTVRPARGPLRAAAWYWRQAAGSIGPALSMRRRRRRTRDRLSFIAMVARGIADAAQDTHFAGRLLVRQKGFTAAAMATLALGIGANTAIFSVVDGVLLRPLPYREPSRLVRVWSANPRGIPRNGISPADYADWSEQVRGFEALAAFDATDVTLTGAGDPVQIPAGIATANLAGTLGAPALRGRWFLAEETRGPAPFVVVIGERLWRERFGAAPDIVGRTIVLDSRPRTVVGVMPRAFQFPSSDQRLWLPLADDWKKQTRAAHFLGVVGRLAPGTDIRTGRDALADVARGLETTYPDTNRGWGVTVVSLRDALVGDVELPLLVLLASVAAVLLIACANVASLMLARGVARSRELAVRAAVGATAGRLLRQQLVESLVLSALGCAAGIALAWWAVHLVQAAPGVRIPLLDRAGLDTRVMTAAIGLAVGSAMLTGLLPALRASRQRGTGMLGAGTRTAGGHVRLRQAIVFAEIAIATALVAGGMLLVRSFVRLTAVPPGFDADRTLLAEVSLPPARYAADARAPFYDRALELIRALPGVRAAGAGGPLPLSGQDGLLRFGLAVEGRAPTPDRSDRAYVRWATPGYFSAMGIALRTGRPFTAADASRSTPVAVIDEALARRFFGAEDPLGRRVMISMEARARVWRDVVGVVGTVRQTALDRDAEPHVYVPETQSANAGLTFVVRSAADPATMTAGVRDIIRGIDPDLPLANVRSLADLVAGSTASRRLNMLLLSLFAGVAVLLTLVGVYGVVSQMVAQSTREIGVRIAMGASRRDVVSLLLTRAIGMALAGVTVGSAVAWIGAPALGGMVYGIAPRDPATLMTVAILVTAAAALAAYVPARRILCLDVVTALRVE